MKILATSASVASGVPGGIFTPVLLVGGGVGLAWAHALTWLEIGSQPSAGSYALVGMAATAAASLHAATVVATAASRLLGSVSVYEAELRRRGLEWELTLEGRRVTSDRRPGGPVLAFNRL